MRLYLIGFMASGKSTFGQQMAAQTGLDFIDLDQKIEQFAGISVSDFFKSKGEAAFRQLEKEILESTAHTDNCIIATGGGTPCFGKNMEWMRQNGKTLWLDVPLPILVQRLINEKETRPLIAALESEAIQSFVADLLQDRSKFYDQADYRLG